ncbi:hypothetical protein V5T82_01895 [Magnetovibrio sp. PR-2]|uniref:hypothetical protein n=1 Tax=Magnetovibrio sp. PR-2 TaxID=3120356 RepID=UPI002FCE27D3
MSIPLILTLIGFTGGFIWGYLTPRGYCSISSVEAKSLKYRFGGGLINGTVVGGVVGLIAIIAFGEG